jgi:hypothetical protein
MIWIIISRSSFGLDSGLIDHLLNTVTWSVKNIKNIENTNFKSETVLINVAQGKLCLF